VNEGLQLETLRMIHAQHMRRAASLFKKRRVEKEQG